MAPSSKLHVPGKNRLLASLPRKEFDRLSPELEAIAMTVKYVFYEANAVIRHVYFPLSGVASVVISMKDGVTVEVGLIGNEGMVGIPAFLGADRSPTKAFTQVPGDALRMRADTFKRLADNGPLRDIVQCYSQALLTQISQSVACNHLHSVEERMCRWLLMTHDRIGADEFPLTQEFLAQMLGVRRPSVTVIAGRLQRAGLISYHRGQVRIRKRQGLEAASCECYGVVKAEFDRLLS